MRMRTITARCSDLWPRLQGAGLMRRRSRRACWRPRRSPSRRAPKIPVDVYRAGEQFTVGPVRDRGGRRHPLDPRAGFAGDHHAARHGHPYRRLEDRPDPTIGPLTDEARFRAIGEEGVLALICDSTNAMREGDSPSEQEVAAGLREVIARPRAGWPSPPSPPMSAASARSRKRRATAGREVLLLGRSMKRVVDVATELGYHGRPAGRSSPKRISAISRATSWCHPAPAARASRAPRSPSWRATRCATSR